MLDTRMTDRIHLLSFDVRFILNTTLYPFERRVNDKKRKKRKFLLSKELDHHRLDDT